MLPSGIDVLSSGSSVGTDFGVSYGPVNTGLVSTQYSFHGTSAHGAGSPWMGRSALDAVELMNVAWNYRREHLRLQHRSHYVIVHGGDQPNVVPPEATVWYFFRELDFQRIKDLHALGTKIARAAAEMTDTTMTERILAATWPGHYNKAVAEALYSNIQINAVIERGVNDDDILELVEFSREHGFALRFIEFMDAGNSNSWKSERMVSKTEILAAISARYPLRETGREQGTAPSVDYEFANGQGDIGVIASVTEPFCASCTRVRLAADGKLVTCLFSETGLDLKSLLRSGTTDEDLSQFVSAVWQKRKDRYSDERLEALHSIQGYQSKDHKKIEMISLGG